MFDTLLIALGLKNDLYIKKAKDEQAKASYPGCPLGLMDCFSFCNCNRPKKKKTSWVKARADFLRKVAVCQHKNTHSFQPDMFPEITMGRVCLDCKAVQLNGQGAWDRRN